ncbi:MAG: hypothetical protein ACREM3_24760 [Candidatus Rokuibacteriota bacterium]
MSERPESPMVLRTEWLAEPGVWVWEIVDASGRYVVESCWTTGWVGYATEEGAEQAARTRLAEIARGRAGDGSRGTAPAVGAPAVPLADGRRSQRGRLIVVPRARSALYRALKNAFRDDANVEVVLDRRFRQRRAAREAREPDRRAGDRRCRTDVDGQLASGRSVTVPIEAQWTRAFDADDRAILFLCCSEHLVGCRVCEQTYRMRWLPRTALWRFSCPGCAFDLTPEVVRHTQTCWYWASRRTGQAASRRATA